MRVARFLVVLGSLLVLCSTASDAHQATSTARVGLKKRYIETVAPEWPTLAAKATEHLPWLPEVEHFVQPNNKRRRANPLQREDIDNETKALLIHRSSLPTDDLLGRRNRAFNTVMHFLHQFFPYKPHETFLVEFRNAVEVYDVLQRASELRRDASGAEDFGSIYMPPHLFKAMRVALTSDYFTSQELNDVIADARRAANTFEGAELRISRILEWYRRLFSHDQVGPGLPDLHQELKRSKAALWKWVERLSKRLRDVEIQESEQSASRNNGQGSSYDQQTWRYR